MAKVETDKKKPDDIWIATKENIDDDFEETRRCLLNSYHSDVQTHAGYIIALMIGFFVIIATFEPFFKSIDGKIAFIILIIAILGTSGLIAVRMEFWIMYVNIATFIPIDDALNYFNKYNDEKKQYSCKAPNTAIITFAIEKQIRYDFEKHGSHKRVLYFIRNIWKQLV